VQLHTLQEAHGVVFVVDASDNTRLGESKAAFDAVT
jgi:hypothetical protein